MGVAYLLDEIDLVFYLTLMKSNENMVRTLGNP